MYREQPEDSATRVTTALAAALAPLRYVAHAIPEWFELTKFGTWSTGSDGIEVVRVKGTWVRKTITRNDAVVHLAAPDSSHDLKDLSCRMENVLADPLGYSWFKPLALLLVWSGDGLWERTQKIVEEPVAMDAVLAALFDRSVSTLRRGSSVHLVSVSAIDLVAKRVSHEPHPRYSVTRPTADAIRKCLLALAGPPPKPSYIRT